MVIGGESMPPCPPAMFPIHTGPPPVPTDRAIAASWGNVPVEAIHTARPSEVGSMRAYMLTRFSQTSVLVGWLVSAAWATVTGLLMTPAGSPTAGPVRSATSSNQEM